MWKREFSKVYEGVSKEQIWQAWVDVNSWSNWDAELDYCDMQGEFTDGNTFILKPKDGPKVKIYLYNIIAKKQFCDYCKFPGAKMHDIHLLEEIEGGVKLTNTIYVTGVLSSLWVKLVAKNVAEGIPAQSENLVNYARKLNV